MDQNIKTGSDDLLALNMPAQDDLTKLNDEAEKLDVSIEIELEDVKTSYSFGEARPH